MLKQNLNDQSFSMANIFSFAEKVISDFKNKPEGDRFLFLYCITAKLLSNRLYDNESAEDKINCLLSRIPEDKKENSEQLKKSLETFIGKEDFSADKVKSFFDTNKDLVNKIYGNEKPADLLFFFAQMQSKNIFTRENNEAFVNGMGHKNIGVSFTGYDSQQKYADHVQYYGPNDICTLNSQVVSKSKVDDALKKDPNRIFNRYLTDLDKTVGLNIFDKNKQEYEKRGFKLVGRQQNYERQDRDIYINETLDIDKILEKKFSFKKINEISKDELGKLNLSYDEEFNYFLASNDFSNEYIFQNTTFPGPFYDFKMPGNIKPETTLKIYDYFVKLKHQVLIKEGINYLRDKFETSKDLLDTYNKLKDSLNFKKDELLEIFIGNPPKVKQVLKCQDTKSAEEINTLLGQCDSTDIINYFVDVDDNKNQDILSKYILQNPKILCNELSHVNTKLDDLKRNHNKDNNENKLKKLQDLMKSFFALKNINELLKQCNLSVVVHYFLRYNEGKYVLLKNIYGRVDKLEYNFESICDEWEILKGKDNKTQQQNNKIKKLEYLITKFLLDCKDKVLVDEKKYIDYIVNMSEKQEKFCMYDLDSKKEIDVTDELKNLLSGLIDKNLGLVENKNNFEMPENGNKQQKDNKVIVEVSGKSYDLTKIYPCDYLDQNKGSDIIHDLDLVENLQCKIEFHKKILKSKAVSQEKKQTIYLLAKKYKEKLQKVYNCIGEQIESEFNENIKKSRNDFLTDLGINSVTYGRLKDADKNKIANRKAYLEKKANVTNLSYLKENWITWLGFIFTFGIMAIVYNRSWKPKYENEINQLKCDLNNIADIEGVEARLLEKKNNFSKGKVEKRIIYNYLNNGSDDNEFTHEAYTVVLEPVAYEFLKNGKEHKKMINEMDEFIEQYGKDFELKEIKQGDIIFGLKPEIEEINTNTSVSINISGYDNK